MTSSTNWSSRFIGLAIFLFLSKQDFLLALPGSLLALFSAWPLSHLLERGWGGPLVWTLVLPPS